MDSHFAAMCGKSAIYFWQLILYSQFAACNSRLYVILFLCIPNVSLHFISVPLPMLIYLLFWYIQLIFFIESCLDFQQKQENIMLNTRRRRVKSVRTDHPNACVLGFDLKSPELLGVLFCRHKSFDTKDVKPGWRTEGLAVTTQERMRVSVEICGKQSSVVVSECLVGEPLDCHYVLKLGCIVQRVWFLILLIIIYKTSSRPIHFFLITIVKESLDIYTGIIYTFSIVKSNRENKSV